MPNNSSSDETSLPERPRLRGTGFSSSGTLEQRLAAKNDPRLPILEFRQDIKRLISTSWILLLKGAVACGKTSQLPQIALCAAGVSRVFLIQHSHLLSKRMYRRLSQEVSGICRVTLSDRYSSEWGDAKIILMSPEHAVKINLHSKLRPTDVVILDEIDNWSEYQVCLNSVLIRALKDSASGKRPFQLTYTSATLLSDFTQWVHARLERKRARFFDLRLPKSFEGAGVTDQETPTSPLPFERYLDEQQGFEDEETLPLKRFARSCIAAAEAGHPMVLAFLPGELEINLIGDLLEAMIADPNTQFARLKQFRVYRVHGGRPLEERDAALEDVSRPKILLSTEVLARDFTPRYFRSKDQGELGVAVIDSQAKWAPQEQGGVALVKISHAEYLQRRGRASKGETAGTYEVVLLREDLDRASTDVLQQGVEQALLHLRRFDIRLEELPVFGCPNFTDRVEKAKKFLQLFGCLRNDKKAAITPKGVMVSELDLTVPVGVFLLEVIARWPSLTEKALLVAALFRNGPIWDRHRDSKKPMRAEDRRIRENGIFYRADLQRLYSLCRSDLLVQAEILASPDGVKNLGKAVSSDSVRNVSNLISRFKVQLRKQDNRLDAALKQIRADACPVGENDSDYVKLRWASFRASPWIIMKRCYSLPLLELQGELNKGHLVHDEKGLLMPPYGSNWFDNEGNFTDDGDRDGFSAWKHPGDDRYSYCLRDVRVSYCLREEPIFVGEVSIHGSKPRVIQLTAIEPEWLKYHPVGFSNEYNSLRLDGTWNGEVAPEDVVPIQVYGVHQRLYFKVPRDHWREKLVFELGSPYWLREIMKSFETTYKIDCLFLFDRLREALEQYKQYCNPYERWWDDSVGEVPKRKAAQAFIAFLWELRSELEEFGTKDLTRKVLLVLMPKGKEDVGPDEWRKLECQLRRLWSVTSPEDARLHGLQEVLSFLSFFTRTNVSLNSWFRSDASACPKRLNR